MLLSTNTQAVCLWDILLDIYNEGMRRYLPKWDCKVEERRYGLIKDVAKQKEGVEAGLF